MEKIETVSEAIKRLGGTKSVAALTGRRDQHISNWRVANRFPANTFLILREALKKNGFFAPPSLWGIKEP